MAAALICAGRVPAGPINGLGSIRGRGGVAGRCRTGLLRDVKIAPEVNVFANVGQVDVQANAEEIVER